MAAVAAPEPPAERKKKPDEEDIDQSTKGEEVDNDSDFIAEDLEAALSKTHSENSQNTKQAIAAEGKELI